MTRSEILDMMPLGVTIQMNEKRVVPDKVKMASGVELYVSILDQGETSGEWTNLVGTAVKVNKDIPTYAWLNEGDTVYIDYQHVKEAWGHMESFYRILKDEENNPYIIITENVRINMAIRNGQIIAPPNRCILKRVAKEKAVDTFLHLPDMGDKKYFDNVFEVVAIGEVDERLNKLDRYRDSIAVPEVGKKILVGMHSGIPVEPPTVATLAEPLFYCRFSEVMAYYEEND